MCSQTKPPALRRLSMAIYVALPLFAACPAIAAETPVDDVSGEKKPAQLDTVTVTAERRTVDQQKAPLSVSTISAEQLDQANINDVTGLNGAVPGLVVAKSGGAERIIAIRGIGSETPENTNTQPGVSLHVDGVYIFNSIAANAAFIDPEQVEVLRGPQGTMFGQGSTGGTINVVSKQPELGVFGGEVGIGIGNYGLTKSNAAINIPAGDTFAVRAAVQEYRHDGYAKVTGVEGTNGDYEADQADDLGGKVAALWKPTEDFSATFTATKYKSDTNAPAQKNILDPETDPRVLSQDYPGKSLIEFDLYSMVLDWDLSWARFKSISAYQKLHAKQSWDSDALTADLFWAQTYSPLSYDGYNYDHTALWQSDVQSYSQEFNLSGGGEKFQWITGAVFLKSTNKQYIVEYRDSDMALVRPPLPVDSAWDSPEVASVTYADLEKYVRKSWAVYFQGTYAFTDRLSLTAGLRYNKDKYDGEVDNYSGGVSNWTSGTHLQPTPRPGLATNEVTGKIALDYQATPSSLLYASFTRGYKPGGLNGSSTADGSAWSMKPTFQPETVNSFEIGSKNRFADNTVQLNASAFLYDYKNMQFLDEDAMLYGEGTSNAPSARIYGLELEGSWLATLNWRFDAGFSYLKGEFDEDYYALDPAAASAAQYAAGYPSWLYWSNFYAAVMAREAARANINGNDVPKMPRYQGNVSATYTNDLWGGLVTAKAEFLYRGKYQYRLFNNAQDDLVPSYNVTNLYFSYAPDESNWSYSLSVTNLFDEDGVNSRFSDPYGSAQVTETYIAPRQYIFSVRYTF